MASWLVHPESIRAGDTVVWVDLACKVVGVEHQRKYAGRSSVWLTLDVPGHGEKRLHWFADENVRLVEVA